jgi:hypothetical protein
MIYKYFSLILDNFEVSVLTDMGIMLILTALKIETIN